jgi:Nucleotide-binding protein implicated in inhibition of septum formation
MERGASITTLHFCEYSDLDIERYITTGEPLEVTGSFTSEGFDGALSISIEGDPHGIIGMSGQLARGGEVQLGVEWTDVWNVTRSDLAPDAEYDAKSGCREAAAAQGERAPAGRRMGRLRLRPQALGYERRVRRAPGKPQRDDR